jgi:hypothetical protein
MYNKNQKHCDMFYVHNIKYSLLSLQYNLNLNKIGGKNTAVFCTMQNSSHQLTMLSICRLIDHSGTKFLRYDLVSMYCER